MEIGRFAIELDASFKLFLYQVTQEIPSVFFHYNISLTPATAYL